MLLLFSIIKFVTSFVSFRSVRPYLQKQRLALLIGHSRVGFHLFGPLKHHLSAEHFPDEAEEREVTAWFRQQPKEFYAAGFQGLVKRWDKCLNLQ
jgi:hypothetical protein